MGGGKATEGTLNEALSLQPGSLVCQLRTKAIMWLSTPKLDGRKLEKNIARSDES